MPECTGGGNCPGIHETKSGDFLVVGLDAVESAQLLPTAPVGPRESGVVVPRSVFADFVEKHGGRLG